MAVSLGSLFLNLLASFGLICAYFIVFNFWKTKVQAWNNRWLLLVPSTVKVISRTVNAFVCDDIIVLVITRENKGIAILLIVEALLLLMFHLFYLDYINCGWFIQIY